MPRPSFTGDTPVLLSDGTTKPIEDLQVGDQVEATDPETGETGTRTITALILGYGIKQMVSITFEDGTTLEATSNHPIWDATQGAWVDAGSLLTGGSVLTDAGVQLNVTGVRSYTMLGNVYNLTVDDVHTYYAGEHPVLVHNTSCPSEEADDALYAAWQNRNSSGGWTVYHGLDGQGRVIYAGITQRELSLRESEHIAQKYGIVALVAQHEGLLKWQARAIEQVLIEKVRASGLSRIKDGKAIGQINSINPLRTAIYARATAWARKTTGLE